MKNSTVIFHADIKQLIYDDRINANDLLCEIVGMFHCNPRFQECIYWCWQTLLEIMHCWIEQAKYKRESCHVFQTILRLNCV